MRYRKKPVEVTAQRATQDTAYLVTEWIEYNGGMCAPSTEGLFRISTLEGDMKVSDGDYVIRGVKGEFYPCKPDIFEMTYEPVR